jgi:hypothetical protein
MRVRQSRTPLYRPTSWLTRYGQAVKPEAPMRLVDALKFPDRDQAKGRCRAYPMCCRIKPRGRRQAAGFGRPRHCACNAFTAADLALKLLITFVTVALPILALPSTIRHWLAPLARSGQSRYRCGRAIRSSTRQSSFAPTTATLSVSVP